MPRKRKSTLIHGTFFKWKLRIREGIYWADGRSNPQSAGRHSLGTREREEALESLQQLDTVRAVELGIADESILKPAEPNSLSLEDGVALYQRHVERPAIAGGASPETSKRYRAVYDKLLPFLKRRHVLNWKQVGKAQILEYAAWLDDEGYAPRTEYLELTTIKQTINWMIREGHLPAANRIDLRLSKPTGTDTYCWKPEEVTGILSHCSSDPKTAWLGDVLMALAYTGVRISELAALRASDVDLTRSIIAIKDETAKKRRSQSEPARQTKGRRSRSFPVHPELKPLLERLAVKAGATVFRGPLGGVLSPDIVRRALIRDVLEPLSDRFPTAAGDIGFLHGRLHSFRHYFCSTCANSGVPEQMVMHWLGHQESKMVRHYYHAHDAEAQRQMKNISFVVGEEDDGPGTPKMSGRRVLPSPTLTQ
jgi:integrase